MELTVFNFTQGPNEAFEILWVMAIGYDWLYNWPGRATSTSRRSGTCWSPGPISTSTGPAFRDSRIS